MEILTKHWRISFMTSGIKVKFHDQFNALKWLSYLMLIVDKTSVLDENIDQTLTNKLHGSMHYKIGDTCIYNGQVFCTLL